MKPVLIKAGIDLSGIGAIDLSKLPDWQKQIVSDYKKASDIMQAGEKGAKKIGFPSLIPIRIKAKGCLCRKIERTGKLTKGGIF